MVAESQVQASDDHNKYRDFGPSNQTRDGRVKVRRIWPLLKDLEAKSNAKRLKRMLRRKGERRHDVVRVHSVELGGSSPTSDERIDGSYDVHIKRISGLSLYAPIVMGRSRLSAFIDNGSGASIINETILTQL